MKWIGQHIYDLISRFRSDVYLEDVSTGTIASGGNLGLDSNNKIVKATTASGDLTSIVAGTGLSGTSLTGPIPTLNVDADQTQIRSIGTIATGVWNGTAIGGNYISATQPNIDSIGTDGDTLSILGDDLIMASTTTSKPQVSLVNQTDDATGPVILLQNQRVDSSVQAGEDDDVLGRIYFKGYNDGTPALKNYSQIYSDIHDATTGEESGRLTFQVANDDGGLGSGLILTGGSENDEIDVTVGLGANSVVTIPGDIDLAGDIDVDGTLETDALTIGGTTIAAIGTTAITTLGTIGTGVWQGTTIKTAYIGDDQVTEDKLANTLLAEIDANTAKVTNADQSKSDIDGLAITTVGTIDTGVWNGTAIASDQQKHVMHYQLAGYGTGDGTNYEVTQNIHDTNAPFEHNTSVGSDGTTAITVANMSRTGGHVMPRACTLKRWTGWGTCAGSQTVYIGLFKASFTRDDSTNVSLVLLDEFSYTAMGNNKMEDFDETSFTATALAAGDMIITAIKSQSGFLQYFNSTVEVEF